MEEKRAETVVDYTIDAMREAIRIGRLAPGQRLVVRDITDMFSVSAGPVREAIRRLTGEGLVEIFPHRGAAVRDISPHDLAELYELREPIEGLAARRAAENIDRGDLRSRLTALVAEMDEVAAKEDIERYTSNNRRFHELICDAAGNERLRQLAAQLSLPIFQLRLPQRMTSRDIRQSYSDHKRIVAALLAGDGARAEAAMRKHVHTSGQELIAVVTANRAARRKPPG